MPYILFQDKKIFYRIEGKGRPVLLLHGFAENGNIWNEQVNLLKENYCVIIPDLPGSGQSEMLEGACTLNDYAEVIKTIADEIIFQNKRENQSQFSLIGHSMGGYITLAFAEKYPGLLNSFGLFHSSAYADDEQKIAAREKGIDFIKKNGVEAFLKISIPDLFSEETRKEQPELITRLFNMAKDILPDVLIQYYRAMILRPDRTLVLKNFLNPVLFIIGEYDTAAPFIPSLQQCHLPSISSVYILQHSGHVGMWEEGKSASLHVKEFLSNTL